MLAVGVWAETSYDELDGRMAKWKLRYPDVQIHPVATRGSLGQFLAGRTDEFWQLTVLGQNEVDQIAFLVRPHSQPADQHRECSVLVVRWPTHGAITDRPALAVDPSPPARSPWQADQ